MTALLTFLTVSTFLAGFAIADYGSFTIEEWQAGDYGHEFGAAYVIMVAFVVEATLTCRCEASWWVLCIIAREIKFPIIRPCAGCRAPVTAALSKGDGLKGKRQELYQKAICTACSDSTHALEAASNLREAPRLALLVNSMREGAARWPRGSRGTRPACAARRRSGCTCQS